MTTYELLMPTGTVRVIDKTLMYAYSVEITENYGLFKVTWVPVFGDWSFL